MVPEAGLEPAHHCWREILNLLCLPISPLWHCLDFTIFPWDTKSLENFESPVSTNFTTLVLPEFGIKVPILRSTHVPLAFHRRDNLRL